jgi:hypothetical protein
MKEFEKRSSSTDELKEGGPSLNEAASERTNGVGGSHTSLVGLSIDGSSAGASPPPELCDEIREDQKERSLEERLQDLEQRSSREKYLEDRVEDLEGKLATLSRLLKLQTMNGSKPHKAVRTESPPPPPPIEVESPEFEKEKKEEEDSERYPTPPRTPLFSDSVDENDGHASPRTPQPIHTSTREMVGSANVPHLESPAAFLGKGTTRLSWRKSSTTSFIDSPSKGLRADESQRPDPLSAAKRNLSFRLLYGGDEKAYDAGRRSKSVPPTASMTLADRKWLGSLAKSINGERKDIPEDISRNKWLNYLNSFQESTPDVDVQMEEFIMVPGQVENIMCFGYFICIDSFLYCVTVLPIRFVWSCFLLAIRLLWKRPSPSYTFHRRHSYQLIQGLILYFIYNWVLAPISIGKLYHWIRGQAMIKLYVLIAIVEVFDRLMCSMGTDCLDSMYWNTVNRPKSSRMLISVAVVLVYCTVHTLFLFVHVATLNVAMNSADQALLALLVSGNFAEIKSTVFKKYNRPALFKLTASDICERFKLGLFLSLVLLLNYCQGMEQGQFRHYLRTCALIWCAELLADWIKHSFITKFNFLPARVFVEYNLLLAGDVTGIGHEGVNVDHSHAVVKRIGFAQLPFVCVMFRLVREAAKYAASNEYWQSLSTFTVCGIFAAFWLLLLAVKLALGSLLHHISLSKLRSAPEVSFTSTTKKNK